MAVRQDTITTVSLKMCPDYLPRLRKIATCLAGSAGMDPHETRALAASCVDTVNHESSLESNGIVSVTFVTCYGDAPAHPSQLAKRDRIERRKDQRTVQEQAAFAEQF